MNNDVVEIESIPTMIRYKDIIWTPKDSKKKETQVLSAEKIRCWIRFKNIQEFNISDLREAFPEWGRYAKSQLLFKLNPLIKDKTVAQFPNNEFKVLKP